ncbi:hypothetical protein DSL72_002771 [Monilinia vaccinii-corymbosi]|uniref:L-ornithine N(5)-monooxygenase [NAD(P)H] n=1 Tax=Monilinia vaccinii-corymbosi TaxID=61207 RepID=A0A8A3PDM8_9HELO|nr:hypothetical protein DSL72_002771 [Monilinia vaccinii-corymbosi]
MSLQTPSHEHPQAAFSRPRPHPHPYPHLSNRVRAYDIISTEFSLAQLSLAIAATVRRSPLSILFLWRPTPEWDVVGVTGLDHHHHGHEGAAVFMQDFATALDPTCRYTFLNYLSEEGILGGWMAKGGLSPSAEEWAGYVRWCVEIVREEGWVDFSEGDVEGMEGRGDGRAVDVLVSGEWFKAERILDGGEETQASTNESVELDMLQATNALQMLCAAAPPVSCPRCFSFFPMHWYPYPYPNRPSISQQNLAALTAQNEKLLSQYEKELASKMVRALL